MKAGQLVRLVPDFCTESEQRLVYVITNTNDETGRALITCINSTLTIPPTETVDYQMIEAL